MIAWLLVLLLAGCGSNLETVSAPAPPSEASRRALAHIILRPGLISLSEGLVAIRAQTPPDRVTPGPKAGYLEARGDSLTFVNWSAEAEEVNGTVTFTDGTQTYSPGFTYAALDGSVRDVIAGGTARFAKGVWTLDVDTTEQVSRARAVTLNLRFEGPSVNGQVQLFTPDAQSLFTIRTTADAIVAESPAGTLSFSRSAASPPSTPR